MTEEEKQQAAVYLKLQDDVEKLIKNTIFNALTNNNEDGDPIDDILHSLIIELITSAIISDPVPMDKSNPCVKLQEAILKLVHPHRS
jgi:hypothetical protein